MTKLVSHNSRSCRTGRNIYHGVIIIVSVYLKKKKAAFVSANDVCNFNKYIYLNPSIFNQESRSERLIICNVYDLVKI